MKDETVFKSGFVSLIGSPNVGKSTIMNWLVGQKISIISDKAQTTRNRIRGIVAYPNAQIVIIDTPGIQKPRTALGSYMLKGSYEATRDVECIVFVVDPVAGVKDRDKEILEKLRKSQTPVIVCINKIDIVGEAKIQNALNNLAEFDFFEEIIQISAKNGDNMDILKSKLLDYMPEGPKYFPDDMITDQPERVMCAEFLREACLENLQEEIPHGIACEIEKMQMREDKELFDIWATIYCERESHKRIIIGKGGTMLKKIGSSARKEIQWLLGCKVNLQVWVKVNEKWRDKVSAMRFLGYKDE